MGGRRRPSIKKEKGVLRGEGDEPSDSSIGSESEPRDEGDGESMANFAKEEDESPEGPSKLAKLQEFISSLPSTIKSSRRAPEDDPNEGKRRTSTI